LYKLAVFLVSAFLLALPAARAQQQPSRQSGQSTSQLPLQPDATPGNDGNDVSVPATGILPPSGGNGSSQVQPDTHVLSGAEMLGLGSLRAHRSFFDPVLRITEGADAGLVPGKTDSTSLIGGGFALDQQWSRSHLIMQYYGSRILDYPDSVFDSSYHNLSFSQTITFGRWIVRLRDDLIISPQSNFGGLDIAGAPLPASDAALTSVTPQLEPAQTIQTGWAERVDNTPLGEVDYSLSRRSTVTLTGSYGLLHFLHSGFIDGNNPQGRAGYTYLLTPKDSIGITYNYSLMRFVGTPSRTQSHLAQVSFAHSILARWAFQLSAGPQLFQLESFGLPSGGQWTWSVTSNLTYHTRRTNYSLAYFREITSGSGVILGAETNGLTATISRSLTRNWVGSLNGGYARNTSLTPTQNSNFGYSFVGVNLGRPLGRHLHFDLNYQHQQQKSPGGCLVATCGLNMGRNIGSIGLEWHPLGARRE
jgi:hypothetical protein